MGTDNQPPVEAIQGEARAREVLAEAYERAGCPSVALLLRGHWTVNPDGPYAPAIAAMLAFQSEARAVPSGGEREEDESAWLVEENAGSGIIHWIALEASSWPRTKIRRRARPTIRMPDDDDFELEDYQTPVRRVKDANEALRFARKDDADAFIALFDRFLLCPVATEHQWPATDSPTLPHQADREAIARDTSGFDLVAAIIRHMGDDLSFVADQMPAEDLQRFYDLRDQAREWLIAEGARLDAAGLSPTPSATLPPTTEKAEK